MRQVSRQVYKFKLRIVKERQAAAHKNKVTTKIKEQLKQ